MSARGGAVVATVLLGVACHDASGGAAPAPSPAAPWPMPSDAGPPPAPGDAGGGPVDDDDAPGVEPWGADGPCGCYAALPAEARPLESLPALQHVPDGVRVLQGDLARGVWLWGTQPEGGAALRLWTARFTSADAPPVVAEVQPNEPSFASPRAASLSADGLVLLLLSSDGRAFGELRRDSVAQPFAGTVHRAAFSALDLAASRGAFHAAVLSADQLRLLLRQARRDAPEFPLALSERRAVGDPWPAPSPLTDAALQETPGSSPRTPLALDEAATQLVFTQDGQLQVACRANDGSTFEPTNLRPLRAGSAWSGQGVCRGATVALVEAGRAWAFDDR